MIEDLVRRRSGRSTRAHARIVLIQRGVGRSIAASVCIVEDADAIGADDDLAPLGIEVEFLGDPETPVFGIGVIRAITDVTPFIHGIGHMGRLIVRRGDRGFVQDGSGRESLRQSFIGIPAVELKACALARWHGDLPAIGNAEVHRLSVGAPVERGVGPGIRMQEHAVLHEHPLGVHRDAANGHGRELIGMRAIAIDIPSVEDESGRIECGIVDILLGGNVVICPVFTIAADIGLIRYAGNLLQFTNGSISVNGFVVAVHIDAIHEGDRLQIARIVVVDFPAIADSFLVYHGHSGIRRRMLLRRPVITLVVRQSIDIFVQLVVTGLVLEVDVVPPLILSTSGIVVGIQVVSILAGKITKDLLIHDGDDALDGSLTGGHICLCGFHDSPAAQSQTVPGLEVNSVICGPLITDVGAILGGQRSVIVGIVTARF